MKGRKRPPYNFDPTVILAIINTEIMYYHIIQYKFGSGEGWAIIAFLLQYTKHMRLILC